MALNISAAEQQDARRIAEIHMAAFATNAMLLAQFPSPTIREGLRECIARKALDDIEDPNIVVLVARDQDHNQIISFAKWSLPNPTGEGYEESPWRWPEGTQYGVLNEWTEKVESAKSNVLGDGPCYRLTFLGTDPQHERRGAASLLLQWGISQCNEHHLPGYLEGTTAAGPLYIRHGFTSAAIIQMTLDDTGIYQETCFLYLPLDDESSPSITLGSTGDRIHGYYKV